MDGYPGYTKDGTMITFLRSESGDPLLASHLMIVGADGSGLRQLTHQPLTGVSDGDGSGDGRSIAVISRIGGVASMTIFDIASGEERLLDVGMPVERVSFRPPNGDELMFVGLKGESIHVHHRRGWLEQAPRGRADNGHPGPKWSPDGSRIAYSQYDVASNHVFTHIVGADGSGDVVLENPPGVIYQLFPVWSPDGRSVVVARGYWDDAAIVLTDNGGVLTARDHHRRRLGPGQGAVRLLLQLRGRVGLVTGRHQDRQRSGRGSLGDRHRDR